MATDVQDPPATPESAPVTTGGGSGGMVKIGAIVLTVVVLQGAATYFLLPTPPATAEEEGDEDGDQVDTDGVEVVIDKFNCTNSIATGHKIHVSVEVVAIVAADQQVSFDEAVNKQLKARVRQTILKVISGANVTELNESGWNTMRRRMREEINKLLRKSYVIEIVFPHYQMMEQ